MIKILFVCHGNICRSTMEQSVMQHFVDAPWYTGDFSGVYKQICAACEALLEQAL